MSDDKELTLLIGDFDEAAIRYLNRVVEGSPTRFLEYPKVYLSVPNKEAVTEVNQEKVDLVFDGVDTLYNPFTGISELLVYMKPVSQDRTELGSFQRVLGDKEIFRPYFCWLLEPNRSLTVKSFTVSAANVLAMNAKPLSATLMRVSATGPTASRFNTTAVGSNPPRSIYAE